MTRCPRNSWLTAVVSLAVLACSGLAARAEDAGSAPSGTKMPRFLRDVSLRDPAYVSDNPHSSTPIHPGDRAPDDGRSVTLSPGRDVPSPVADQGQFSFLLFDRLEYGMEGLHWDVLGWQGGDVHRWWFKSEGDQSTRGKGGEADVQFLRGKLISPFLDFQYGVRYEGQWGNGTRGRAFAVLGLQGLAPYRYEIEPALFISQDGDLSARFTATYDVLLSQRLIVQPRLEANAAVQRVERFGVGSGLNDVELALLVRYEIRREFAPYVGISWKNSFGDTRRFLRREGVDPSRFQLLAGVRAWF